MLNSTKCSAVAITVLSSLVFGSRNVRSQVIMHGAVRQVGEYQLIDGGVDWLDVSSDGTQMLVGNTIKCFDLVDVPTLERKRNFRTLASKVSFTYKDNQLVVTSFIPNRRIETKEAIEIIDAKTEEVISTIPAFPRYRLDRNRELLAFAGPGKECDTVCLYDLKNGAIIRRWKVEGAPVVGVLAFSKSGILGVTPMDVRTVLLWFPPYDKPPLRLETGNHVSAFDVSPDGRTAAFGTKENRVELWDLTKKELIHKLDKHKGSKSSYVSELRFSSDGAFLVSLSLFGEVIVWETQKFKEIARFDAHDDLALAMTFFPDGRTFATGADDGLAKLWKIETEL